MHNVGELLTQPAQKTPLAPMLDRISEVPVLPHVIFSILEPAGLDEPTACEMERAICLDPGLAAKVLVLANSSAFGMPRQVSSIQQAVNVLGYRSIRTLAMTAGTFEMFVGKNDSNSLRRRRWWRHSVDTAGLCKRLAEESSLIDPADAQTAGLLHVMGKSLLDRYGGSDYSLVTERQASGERDWEAETTVYGCNHIELLAALGEQWWLPPRLLSGLEYHREPVFTRGHAPMRACLAIGTRLASAVIKGKELGSGDLADCPEWALAMLGMTRERLRFVLDEGIGARATCQ